MNDPITKGGQDDNLSLQPIQLIQKPKVPMSIFAHILINVCIIVIVGIEFLGIFTTFLCGMGNTTQNIDPLCRITSIVNSYVAFALLIFVICLIVDMFKRFISLRVKITTVAVSLLILSIPFVYDYTRGNQVKVERNVKQVSEREFLYKKFSSEMKNYVSDPSADALVDCVIYSADIHVNPISMNEKGEEDMNDVGNEVRTPTLAFRVDYTHENPDYTHRVQHWVYQIPQKDLPSDIASLLNITGVGEERQSYYLPLSMYMGKNVEGKYVDTRVPARCFKPETQTPFSVYDTDISTTIIQSVIDIEGNEVSFSDYLNRDFLGSMNGTVIKYRLNQE